MARTYYAVRDTTTAHDHQPTDSIGEAWGSWAAPAARRASAARLPAARCLANCAWRARPAASPGCGLAGPYRLAVPDRPLSSAAPRRSRSVPVVGCLAAGADCATRLRTNSSSHCCSQDGGPPQGGWAWSPTSWRNACQRHGCNTATGNWEAVSRFTYCALGQKCMAGKGCGNCSGADARPAPAMTCAPRGGGNSDCNDSDLLWAKDPNATVRPRRATWCRVSSSRTPSPTRTWARRRLRRLCHGPAQRRI